MRRSRTLLLVASLVLAGCAGGTAATDAAGDPPATTAPAASTPATSATTAAPVPTTRVPAGSVTTSIADDRPEAPDFSLDLGDGGTFVLSEETRPVFMVFWAEW